MRGGSFKRACVAWLLVAFFFCGAAYPQSPAPPFGKVPVYDLIKLKPDQLKSALVKLYGPTAKVRWDKPYESWIAETPSFTVEVAPYKGRVLNVLLRFPRRVEIAQALSTLGLRYPPPTKAAPAAFYWQQVFDGIDEVMAIRNPDKSSLTVHILVTPNVALYEQWSHE